MHSARPEPREPPSARPPLSCAPCLEQAEAPADEAAQPEERSSAPPDSKTITEHELEQCQHANQTGRQPVAFVHGLWLLPSSWDRWAQLFEDNGCVALTPGRPDDPETVEEAAEHPDVFAGKSIGQIADHFETIIRGLNHKPAIIGHSTGGLLTQILAGRGLAAVSVAIDPAPFRGVLPLPISTLKSSFPVLGNPAKPQPRGAADLRTVPLRLRQRRHRGRGQTALRHLRRADPGQAALPGGRDQPQSLDRGQGRHQQPRPRTAALHLRRAGQHRPVGDRQRLLQAAARQPGPDRDREDPRPGARPDHRQRLA
ncbi:esterase/lipase family protein [Streptomyces griseus]|uniref:esterase/lipase family protein n=1 Tax=Streptomyces griseus TaxID=1911 RepID=UPI00373AF531